MLLEGAIVMYLFDHTLLPATAGFAGVALHLLAYTLMASGRLLLKEHRFPLMNLAAALLVLFSLLHGVFLPAILLKLAWAGISLLEWLHARSRAADSPRRRGGSAPNRAAAQLEPDVLLPAPAIRYCAAPAVRRSRQPRWHDPIRRRLRRFGGR